MDIECPPLTLNRAGIGELKVKSPSLFDKRKIEDFLERLSTESIYHRFFRLVKDYGSVVDKMLSEDTVVTLVIEKDERFIGCAEVYKTKWLDVGEPAVALLDEYHGRGLGTFLVFTLALCAYGAGIKKLRAYVFHENIPAIRIASKFESKIVENYEDSLLIEMDIEKSLEKIKEQLSKDLGAETLKGLIYHTGR